MYDVLIDSIQAEWIQGAFDMFDRVGTRTNMGKKVGIICQLFHAFGKKLDADYERRIVGEGMNYLAYQKQWVQCT